ncbi:MAG: ATP-dependent protease ATPase subunit HslU [Clostridia bacterium]|nr:ATP-dependent protease ATPase subunit HslU [Clostridia bacterium]MDE6210429.1 ATP-dependent protease ATPase subunit HslU [Clostridia bacterium]MDE6605855.1 ATP-dependent protease ATPase subunit HslU [Clostridia bacterium]
MNDFTPKQIVAELDRYIIGQQSAKKAVAVALRNRYRRSRLPESLREEISPKNIIMQGPTGVGKTEIARRLAKLVKAPFIKVEATKFTEVGYVGRDVESMIRDLVEASIRMVSEEKSKEVELRARERAEEKLVPAITKKRKEAYPDLTDGQMRGYILQEIREGKVDDLVVTLELPVKPKQQTISNQAGMEININELFGSMMGGGKTKSKTVTVKEALKILIEMEEEKLIDPDNVNAEAISRAENEGIIFIDEIDKIASKSSGSGGGHDVSREGVQRDILPIVEGCTVNTKYGQIKTDHILFIAAGAFHISSVSDLIPELQGRFPISVRLDSLTEKDFEEILTKPDNAILMQYTALLGVDNIKLKFTAEAIKELAKICAVENENKEDIGARRLHTMMESLLEDISYEACDLQETTDVTIDKAYVDKHFESVIKKLNLNKYIL